MLDYLTPNNYCMIHLKECGTKQSWPDWTEQTEEKKIIIVGDPAEIRKTASRIQVIRVPFELTCLVPFKLTCLVPFKPNYLLQFLGQLVW